MEEVESAVQRKANVHFGIEGLEAATDDEEEEYSAVLSEGSIAEVASKSSRGGGNGNEDEYEEEYSSEFEKSLDISRDSAAASGSKAKVREAVVCGHASPYRASTEA